MNHRKAEIHPVLKRRLKPYPSYKDSGIDWIGRIPAHWEVAATKRLCHITNGGTPKSGEPRYWDGEITWVTPEDLGFLNQRYIQSSKRMLTRNGQLSSSATMIPKGSLILSTRAPIGHIGLADVCLCTNQGCRSLVFRHKCSNIYHYFQFFAYRTALEKLGQGSTFYELSSDNLGYFKIALPPLTEQRAIAAFLDRETARIDALVAKKERLIELLQEKRTALISHAVTKGLDPNAPRKDSGVEWLGKIPAQWDVTRLKSFAMVQLSNVDKKSKEGEEDVRLCNYVDVYYNEQIDRCDELMRATATSEQVRRFSLRAGDVIITKDSETWLDIAVPAVVSEDLPGVLCGYHLAHIRPHAHCNGGFLSRIFAAIGPRDQYHIAANGITRFGLTGDSIRSGVFALPPLPEQRAIAAFLDRETTKIDALVARVEDAIESLNEFRQALISAAVTGKIDVREEVP